MASKVEFSELTSRFLPEPVAYAVVTPSGDGPFPLCLVLMGGGGSRQTLVDCQPLFDQWWSQQAIAPMVLATPSAGMSYYLEDPEGGVRWETLLIEEFIPHLRQTCHVHAGRDGTAITGISMGGYGALKTAFAHPEEFAAVAAMNPMLEPGWHDADIRPRNRLHHSAGGPQRFIGPSRDPNLFEANHPAHRARNNARRITESCLAIYIEVGDNDCVNAHDGTEFLHRVLWDLDISHEYRLIRGADHGGRTFRPRMLATCAWVSDALRPPVPEDSALEAVREQLKPARAQAAAIDATALRRFGLV